MRKLRQLHLYLGSLFGPMVIVFAVSGGWQVFRFNDAKKDGSSKPAPVMSRRPVLVTLLLFTGIALPAALLVLAR